MQANFVQKANQVGLQFMHPQSMLQALLPTLTTPCNCGQKVEHDESKEKEISEEIRGLQSQITNIRSQVLQVQNLLHVRDDLYRELDQLREQRQHIQSQIQSSSVIEQTQTVKYSGYKEMNERLRRRIFQIREYIQKMTYENQKIEEGLISNQYIQQQQDYHLRRREVQQQPVYEGKRFNATSFDNMVSRLHQKQDEAWRRVRRQQQDIDRRNMQARTRKGNNFTYYSPKARTYYSPNRQIY